MGVMKKEGSAASDGRDVQPIQGGLSTTMSLHGLSKGNDWCQSLAASAR